MSLTPSRVYVGRITMRQVAIRCLVGLCLVGSTVSAAEPTVTSLVDALKACESLETCAAVRTLIQRGPAIWPALGKGLVAPDEMTRFWTLGVLSEVPVPAARSAISTCIRDPEIRVRAAAAYALGAQGSREVTATLLTALRDKDLNVRFAAAVALARVKDPKSIDGLIVACTDEDEDVRAYSALALGDIGDRRATAAVLERLERDHVAQVRGFAGMALSKLRDPASLTRLMSHAEVEADPKALAATLYALGELGDRRALPIVQRFIKHPHEEVREYAQEAATRLSRQGTTEEPPARPKPPSR